MAQTMKQATKAKKKRGMKGKPSTRVRALRTPGSYPWKKEAAEAVTKKMGSRNHAAGDFLVVEDPKETSTWHLPVKVNGKADRRLMGAAWAALHSGYRGSKYSGPKKAEALSKLKGLYKSIGAETPTEESDTNADELWIGNDYLQENDAQPVEEYERLPYSAPWGVKSFEDMLKAAETQEASERIYQLSCLFPQLVSNILGDPMEEDKPGKISALAQEYSDLVAEELNELTNPAEKEPGFAETLVVAPTEFAEVETDSQDIVEVDGEKKRTLAYVLIQAIEPGWGNRKDNNYYPAEVVGSKQTRDLFIKKKMYETDHDDTNRSTANWVSTIVEDRGVNKLGAPTFKVAIHDPGFAERMRNLKSLNLLDMMECSIQGSGKGVGGFEEGGRRGQKITEFDDILHVDWVTRAGAGGRAIEMEESEPGGNPMEEKNKQTPVAEKGQPVPTAIKEHEDTPTEQPAAPEAPAADPQTPAVPATPAAPEALEDEAVKSELAKSNLPKLSQEKLAKSKYPNLSELQAAITAETAYVSELTGAGKPVGMGETAAPGGDPAALLERELAAKRKVNERHFN